jgi:subtilisin-like proprotein convertase family protein
METCVPTNIGAAFPISFPGGLMFRNGVLYTWNQTAPYQLYSVDTVTGVHTLVFNITGVPQSNLSGMSWDGTTVYGMSTSLSASQIFSINMVTGVCTPIGVPSTVCAGGITLLGRPGAQHPLFVLDIVADNLYRFNKTTGVATLIGPLGVDINFGQDGSVDPNDSTFYAMIYSTSSQLRKVDTESGLLGPPLCTYSLQGTGIACVPAGGSGGGMQITFCRNGLNIPIINNATVRDSVQAFLSGACTVSDVNVRIDTVIHTWVSDLRFYLQKGNTGSLIINWVGGSGDNFINTVLNDSAAIPISSGTAPFTGSFRPSNPLTPFNGQQAGGFWRLVITDTASADTGILRRWCVIIVSQQGFGCSTTVRTEPNVLIIPNHYVLEQNYPNPFNPVTKIKYGLPENANVKLIIYDILGSEISVLVNEHKTANTYEVEFDASRLPSGVYFYKLETDNFTFTKKMLLIK